MSSTLRAVHHRAERYASDTPYRYGRALELGGQAVESLYVKTPNPLGVGISGRLSLRVISATIASIFAVIVGVVAHSAITSGSSGASVGAGPSTTISNGFSVIFLVVPLIIVVMSWSPVVIGLSDLKAARAMVARGQELMSSGSPVDTKDVQSDMENIWAQAMALAATRVAMNRRRMRINNMNNVNNINNVNNMNNMNDGPHL